MLARNVRVGPDEIDLLVSWGRLLVAVEVKTRIDGDPAEEFTPAKAARFRRAGGALAPAPARYDLIAVRTGPGGAAIRWLPGAC